MKTAITIDVTPKFYSFEPRKEQAKLPSGFVPDECFCKPDHALHLRVEDMEGALLDVNACAFQFGPLAFWRKPFGFIFVIAQFQEILCYAHPVIVTLRGEMR